MRARVRELARTRALLVLVALAGAWAIIFSPGAPHCVPTANADAPTDWCYTMPITVTYTGSGTVTNQAVRVDINALGFINTGVMNESIWDLYPYTGSFDQETDATAQDLTLAPAGWWFQVPSISQNDTVIVTTLFGRNDIQRDQGTIFTGNDSAAAPHSANFNITDDLSLTVELEMIDAVAQTSTLAGHWSGNAGYELTLTNPLGIRGRVDASTCDVAWNAGWTDTNRNITMAFANPNLTISVDGVVQNTCNTGLGSIATTSTPFTMGNSLSDGIIREVRLLAAGNVRAHWGFNPSDMAETVSINPYQGTVVDISGNGHTATYTFNRDQSDWSAIAGSVTLVSAGGGVPQLSGLVTDLIGPRILGPIDLGSVATPTTGDWITTFLTPAASSFTGPAPLVWSAIFGGMAMMLALGAWMIFKYVPLVLFVAGIPFLFAVVRGFLPPWYLLVWALLVVMGWWAVRQGEGGAA